MKRVKWRKLNDYLKSLEEEQSRRLSDFGTNAHNAFTNPPTEVGTLRLRWVDQIKRQMI